MIKQGETKNNEKHFPQFPIWQISPCFTKSITDDDILIAQCAGQHKAINTSAELQGCSEQFPGGGMTWNLMTSMKPTVVDTEFIFSMPA